MNRKYLLMSVLIMFLGTAFADDEQDRSFVHGIKLEIDGKNYYLAGAPDGVNGATDVPGHDWIKVGKNRLLGRHHNSGPNGAAKWWSSDAADGELLYVVEGVIDTWSEKKGYQYFAKGFTHYHEIVSVSEGIQHPTKVLWLKHVAVKSFTLDGGPPAVNDHMVKPGVDYEFVHNWFKPYPELDLPVAMAMDPEEVESGGATGSGNAAAPVTAP